jgi:hypothetical protein
VDARQKECVVYELTANNKRYTIIEHAAERMLQRGITDEMVIDTMENGDVITQPNGRDRYEKEIDLPDGSYMIVQVIVEENEKEIITIIDYTRD